MILNCNFQSCSLNFGIFLIHTHTHIISLVSPYEFIEFAKLALSGFLQSSLAAARADNFYYPPEWSPNQVHFFGSCSITLLK